MKTDIQQNNLIIAGITIPLLAAANMDMKVTIPYTFHNPYIYHVSQRDEARLLRRILIHGLLPTYRVCKKTLVDDYKNKKINHPIHLQKFGKVFLQSHRCIMPNGTIKNCWDAYRNGDFIALGRKERFNQRILPKIGGFIFFYLLAAICFYTCMWLLEYPIDKLGIIILYFLTAITAIPFIQRIINFLKEFSFLILPSALMICGAFLNLIVPHNNQNVIIVLWTSLGSIGTVLCLGGIGIFAVITSFMCMFDIFKSKYL